MAVMNIVKLGTDGFAIQSGNQPNQNVTYSFLYLAGGATRQLTSATNYLYQFKHRQCLAKTKAL